MFDTKLPVSYYKEIAVLNKEHGLFIVQHNETGKIYVKKVMTVYNRAVYEKLYAAHVRNTPCIYALYEENGMLTVIEEYISGDTLDDVLAICGPLPEEDVIRYTIMLCDILSELHSFEPAIVHRDLKPSNLLLTEDERIVLIDMNAARIDDREKSRDTKLLGTEDYAAPEQFGFAPSSPRTDLYAVGVLMNTLLTGNPSTERIAEGKLTPVIRKCLEMSPKDRYRSASQLKEALMTAQRGKHSFLSGIIAKLP